MRLLNPAELAGSPADYRAYGPYDMNAYFIDCVRRRIQPETHFDDALKTMELIDAIYRKQF
jgi:predicted dehydrogenase